MKKMQNQLEQELEEKKPSIKPNPKLKYMIDQTYKTVPDCWIHYCKNKFNIISNPSESPLEKKLAEKYLLMAIDKMETKGYYTGLFTHAYSRLKEFQNKL